MIELAKGARVVERLEDLPNLTGVRELFQDVETTFGPGREREAGAFHPYKGDRILGIAVTADDHEGAWYIPLRHRTGANLPLEGAIAWNREVMRTCGRRVNHNVKFDAHFEAADGIEPAAEMVDTLPLAKTINSDRFEYGLKTLAWEWCDIPSEEQTDLKGYLRAAKTNDFAVSPIDLMAKYACADVRMNRAVWAAIQRQRPDDMADLWRTEIALTSLLFRVERAGLPIDVTLTKREGVLALRRLIQIADRVQELLGVELVDSNACFHEIICVQLGLPVLARTDGDTGSPSFDKDALALYAGHPTVFADARASEVIRLLSEYRAEERFKSLYVDSFLDKVDPSGRVHPSYNQTVRTGRMSCSDPNAQQLSHRARALVVPKAGNALVCWDASQIEFRIIVHYCQDEEAIARYNSDPKTDYHQWVADSCGATRKEAKTLNFAMAFGAGKRRVVSTLAGSEDTVKLIADEVEAEIVAGTTIPENRAHRLGVLVGMRAEKAYQAYHEALPAIRVTAEKARRICAARGYVRNLYGRRRHLPVRQAHRAFNSLNQGGAADLVKERAVALEPIIAPLGGQIVAIVHDEILVECPIESVERIVALGRETLEQVSVPIRVPILWESGWSPRSWAEAKP